MKALRTSLPVFLLLLLGAFAILHLRREAPAKMKNMIPAHVWKIAEPYDLTPKEGERLTHDKSIEGREI